SSRPSCQTLGVATRAEERIGRAEAHFGEAMYRRRTLILTALACVSVHGNAAAELINFRFGILRTVADGVFEFVSETRRIPLKTKDTGFRFGVGFDNPQCEAIEWYEVMHLPEETREVSGNFQRAGRKS